MAGSQPVQSVARASELLKQVGRSSDGLTLQQLAQRLDLKPPTVHHLARTLVEAQLLEKVSHPTRYRIGPAIYAMVQQHNQQKLRRDAREVLGHLAGALPRANVTLAQWVGGEICVMLRIAAEQPDLIQEPIHQAMSPYSSASSLVFQAFGDPVQQQQYRQRYPFEDYGLTWKDVDELDAFLLQARGQGYVARPNTQGMLAIAAPVWGAGGQLVAAMGVAERFKSAGELQAALPRISQQLVNAASDLSQRQATKLE